MTDQTNRPPVTDGPWTIGPVPAYVRYVVLGAEGAEELLIYGHDLDEARVHDTIRHAGFGRILDFYTELADDEHVETDVLAPAETWAREVYGCPRHRWLPWWVRHGVIRPVDWARWRVFRLVWRVWRRGQDPLDRPPVPRRLRWLGQHWRAFADCSSCEYVEHYRTCDGCDHCDSDGSGKAPSRWDWSTPEGAPHDANAGRLGYVPVTVVDVAG